MKKLTSLILVVSLLLIGLSGIAVAETNLDVWTFWSKDWIEPAIEDFESENPDVNVSYQQLTWDHGLDKITAAVSAGNAPDVVELGSTWMGQFVESQALTELDISDVRDEYTGWRGATVRGGVYGIPWFGSTNVVYYNVELMEEAGLNPEEPPETWSELKDASEAINELGPGTSGFSLKIGGKFTTWQKFLPLAWSNGGEVLSEDWKSAKLDSEAFQEALEFYNSLKSSSLVATQEEARQAFYLGRLGMIYDGPGLNIDKEAPDMEYVTSVLPKPEGMESVGFSGADFLTVPEQSEHPELATELALEISQGNLISSRVNTLLPFYQKDLDALLEDHPELKSFASVMENATSPPPHPKWVSIQEEITKAVESTLLGRGTAESNLREAQNAVSEMLEEYNSE
ncbi:extracellular solute-binding protein [Candidatus Bipolaricaulota bacterium]|nr:extracellular solute-binding protein [Candidatus Bipolaricaulota bacterium]